MRLFKTIQDRVAAALEFYQLFSIQIRKLPPRLEYILVLNIEDLEARLFLKASPSDTYLFVSTFRNARKIFFTVPHEKISAS